MTTAKICGLKTAEAVAISLHGGASHLGFMMFERSPRFISVEKAAELAALARGRAKVVAILVDPSDLQVLAVSKTLHPDLIQLHGRETPARVVAVRALSGAGIIKVLPVSDSADLDTASQFEAVADYLMFETKPPKDADRPGGNGKVFDWSLLAERRFNRPWFLAGGLTPDNVARAIGVTGAPLVDVSSGVERAPGLKDPALIEAFLAAVRRA